MAVSSLATLLCLGSAGIMAWQGRTVLAWTGLLPLAIIAGGALFTVRGYVVTSDCLLVHRLCWATRLPLAGLESVRFEPGAMRGSIRTFGNGVLFSFTGYFRNQSLGPYRAFVTDPQQTVVLRYADRIVMVSPSPPEEFVRDLSLAASARRGN